VSRRRLPAIVLAVACLALWTLGELSSSARIAPASASRARAHPGLTARARARIVLVDVFGRELGACFLSLADRETGGTFNPRAANWTDWHPDDGSRGSFGLLQIGADHRAAGEAIAHFARRMFVPRANALEARVLFREAGLSPWGGSCG
jgi:hypothetical protein